MRALDDLSQAALALLHLVNAKDFHDLLAQAVAVLLVRTAGGKLF